MIYLVYIHYFLGIEVCFYVNKEKMVDIQQLLDKAKMVDCNPLSTPIVVSNTLSENFATSHDII